MITLALSKGRIFTETLPFLAAAGIYALENNVGRLAEDHRRAKEIGAVLEKLNWVAKVEPIETNILIFTLHPQVSEAVSMEKYKIAFVKRQQLAQGYDNQGQNYPTFNR